MTSGSTPGHWLCGLSQMWAWSLAFKCGYRGPPEPAELHLFFDTRGCLPVRTQEWGTSMGDTPLINLR